ncbi:hypothetical protein ACWJJH_12395 [Endozoicomonadaceae bacterium StTr2]
MNHQNVITTADSFFTAHPDSAAIFPEKDFLDGSRAATDKTFRIAINV